MMIRWYEIIFLALAVLASLGLAAHAQSSSTSVALPVPRSIIQAGVVLADTDLIERRFSLRTARQFAVVPHRRDVVGMVARRSLMPGQPIPLSALEPMQLVKRGETARLLFQEQGLIIMMQVEVLQSGGVGEVVRVRNVDSGIVVSGKVRSDGAIEVEN